MTKVQLFNYEIYVCFKENVEICRISVKYIYLTNILV